MFSFGRGTQQEAKHTTRKSGFCVLVSTAAFCPSTVKNTRDSRRNIQPENLGGFSISTASFSLHQQWKSEKKICLRFTWDLKTWKSRVGKAIFLQMLQVLFSRKVGPIINKIRLKPVGKKVVKRWYFMGYFFYINCMVSLLLISSILQGGHLPVMKWGYNPYRYNPSYPFIFAHL